MIERVQNIRKALGIEHEEKANTQATAFPKAAHSVNNSDLNGAQDMVKNPIDDWGNWDNWGNWNDWKNWNNWDNWGDWGNA